MKNQTYPAYQHHKNQPNGQYKKIKEIINNQLRGTKDPLNQGDYQRQKHQQDAKNNSPCMR